MIADRASGVKEAKIKEKVKLLVKVEVVVPGDRFRASSRLLISLMNRSAINLAVPEEYYNFRRPLLSSPRRLRHWAYLVVGAPRHFTRRSKQPAPVRAGGERGGPPSRPRRLSRRESSVPGTRMFGFSDRNAYNSAFCFGVADRATSLSSPPPARIAPAVRVSPLLFVSSFVTRRFYQTLVFAWFRRL